MLNFDTEKIMTNYVGNNTISFIHTVLLGHPIRMCAPVRRQTACMKPSKRFVAGVDYARIEDATPFIQVSRDLLHFSFSDCIIYRLAFI